MKKVRIVSDGTARGTRVLNVDGTPIVGVSRLEILPLEPDCVVQARVTLNLVELDLVADVIEPQHEPRPADDA